MTQENLHIFRFWYLKICTFFDFGTGVHFRNVFIGTKQYSDHFKILILQNCSEMVILTKFAKCFCLIVNLVFTLAVKLLLLVLKNQKQFHCQTKDQINY